MGSFTYSYDVLKRATEKADAHRARIRDAERVVRIAEKVLENEQQFAKGKIPNPIQENIVLLTNILCMYRHVWGKDLGEGEK